MARSYAKILLETWGDESDFDDLPAKAQWLYWVLLSHPVLSPAGVLPLQPRQWAKRAPDMTVEDVEEALEILRDEHKVIVDDDTEEALVRTFVRHDGGAKNANVHTGILNAISRIQSRHLRDIATHQLALARGEEPQGTDPDEPPRRHRGEHRGEQCAAQGQPLLTPEILDPDYLEPDAYDHAPSLSLVVIEHDPPPTFAAFWKLYPRKVSKIDTEALWDKLSPADKRAAIAAVPAHEAKWRLEHPETDQFMTHPDRWLRRRRWQDEIRMPEHKPTLTRSNQAVANAIAKHIGGTA